MADSNTIVPFNKCPSVGKGSPSKPTLILPVQSWYGGDKWVGTADEIVASGLVSRDQLPGERGNNKVCATFYRGNLVGRGGNVQRDENYLNITRYGKTRFIVKKGVSKDEKRRRDTQEILLKKSPDVDFSLLAPALFFIGEKVLADGVCVNVVDIRYNNGYVYKIDPSPDDKYDWYTEPLLNKYTAKPASIIALPSAALAPVQQSHRRGRLPKDIASFWEGRYKRLRRDEQFKKLRAKLRDLNRSIDYGREAICKEQADLIEVKKQIQELFR